MVLAKYGLPRIIGHILLFSRIASAIGYNIHEQKEQDRIEEQQRKETEKRRQEDLRNTTFTIAESSFTVASEGSTVYTKIKSNREWEITDKPLWVLTRWDGNKLEIVCDYNPKSNNRQGTITISTKTGQNRRTLQFFRPVEKALKSLLRILIKFG